MVTFTKFGSCVTTDLFNFLNMSKYYPQYVYTGINIDTALSQADISVPEECIVAESGFWIKMQKYCFHHEPFDNLIKNLQSDFLFLIYVMNGFRCKIGGGNTCSCDMGDV